MYVYNLVFVAYLFFKYFYQRLLDVINGFFRLIIFMITFI